MKKLTIFETSIIGLFIGAIAATFIVFLSGTNGFIGKILSFVSLLPILNSFNVSANDKLTITFLFVVSVYALYGLVVGFIIKKSNKASFIVIGLMVLLPVAVFFEQQNGANKPISEEINMPISANVIGGTPKLTKVAEQYFGQEAKGDINDDNKSDVAFLMSRPDGRKITLYYLAASLKTDTGHTGTNIIFLGDTINPVGISIATSTIIVEYNDLSNTESTSTKEMYFKVIDEKLKQVAKSSL